MSAIKIDKKMEEEEEKELPILEYKEEIIQSIRDFPVTVITGNTGCGKTTKVPQFILEDGNKRRENINVLISQPRKIAAITIAKRVSVELKSTLGGIVGYQVGLDKKMSKMDSEGGDKKTCLLYCTTGVILQKLIKKKSMEGYSHIILDEIHERDIDTDLLMAVLREFLRENPNETRIILMSATLNAEKYIRYFTLTNGMQKEIVPPVISMKSNRPFKIEIYYLDHLDSNILQSKKRKDIIDYSTPTISNELYQIAARLLLLTLKDSSKSILVFLPGINEIESLHAFLRSYAKIDELCIISILHSQLPASEQKEIFYQSTLPRIILSTNLAESSITIPNVETVVDFCLTKNIVVEKESSMANLKVEWASKHNCEQRAGRTGRVCDGRVIRMIHERYYNRYIKEEPVAEMTRAPLETTILRIKMIYEDNPSQLINRTIDPPKYSAIVHSVLVLKELGGLKIYDSEGVFLTNDGEITFIGQIMAMLPLDPRLSKLIVMGHLFGVIEETIILAAALNVKNIFPNRYDKKMEDFLIKLKWAQGSSCDALTMLNAYKFWLHSSEDGKLRDWKVEVEWCKQQNLERKSLHEMQNLISEIKHRLTDLKLEFNNFNWKTHEIPMMLKICMAGAFYPNFFMLGASDEFNEKEVYRGLMGLDPNRTIYFVNFKQEYIGELYSERIKEQMVECGITNSTKDMKVIFDSSKVFIQFPESSSCIDNEDHEAEKVDLILPGKLQLEIYKAVKYRRLALFKERHNRSMNEAPDTAFKLKVLPVLDAKSYAIDEGLATDIHGSLKINKYFYEYPEHCVLPQYSDSNMTGKISNVDHCEKFFFQPNDDSGGPNVLLCIQNSLKKETLICSISPVYNELVIALLHAYYYRAKVVAVNSNDVDCYFFDFGCTKTVPFKQIFQVNKDFFNEYFFLPEQGFECKLSNIEPSFSKCPNGKWTKSAIEFFRQAVQNQECEIEIYSVINDVASVELKIGGKSINEMLIMNGFARKCEESYASRVNHAERESYQLTNTHWVDRTTEFKHKENSMALTFIPAPPMELCINTLNLKGPYTPLESRVIGASCDKIVKIDQMSVNSACLDMHPESYDGQLLIAADMVGNRSNEITLHNVTAMPNIQGLAPLLAMIFAPSVIFECDSNFKRICELRCSLKYDSEFDSYFPKHECTLPVNVEFDADDFDDINELRFNMSCLLMKISSSDEVNGSVKNEMVDTIKKLIFKMFQKNRKPLKALPINTKKVFARKGLGQVYLKQQDLDFMYNPLETPKLRKNLQ